uniref:Pannexin-2-like n=1 Tax=Sinocyclocheilus anshuiensis TaxID=1608454 RepID=A0A671L830_9TELE
MQNIFEQNLDMATALLAGEKLKELILPGSTQDEKAGVLAGLMVQLKLELPFDRVVTIGTVIIPILLVTLVFTRNFAEESIYCYTPHNFTRDQALYARGYCWTELRDAVPGVDPQLWPSLFEHKFLPYALLAFTGIMYIPALGWFFIIYECWNAHTYYARQRQNEFTCVLGEPPDTSSIPELRLNVNCKLSAVQLQRIMAAVDIALLCTMNLIILVNLLHLFVVRKSNFVFDKLHKVGIKTRRRWQKSQFCDINILAMFCNENRDHIKSLNRLDFITNESDLMYDNVVRQLLAALAQSNHDATPTVRDSEIQTVDPSMDPSVLGVGELGGEPSVIKRPRKKIKWIPTSNPLPQPFKEPLTLTRLENSIKAEKPKPVRRKYVADSIIAPLLDSKSTQHPPTNKETNNIEKKHTLNLSLDVHPYMLTIQKAKTETVNPEPPPVVEHSLSNVYIEGPHTVVHVSSSHTEKKESTPLSTTTAFSTASYMNVGMPSMPPPDFPKVEDPLNQGTEPESQPGPFSRNPSHPLDRLARPGEFIAAGEC